VSTLIQRILSGDTQATLLLYRQYAPRIDLYLKKKLPREEDVKEILNDVFLEAIDSLPMLKKEENLNAWLYRIAHNKIVDFYRKKKIKSILLSQVPFLDFVASEIHQPEFQFEKNKVRDHIETTLKHLSKKYQQILRLHYEENIPIKDIAVIFNLSFKATESLLFRARKSFKETYERT
jgi:RNA polymerase sigma-70 factor (ECF subfamily)